MYFKFLVQVPVGSKIVRQTIKVLHISIMSMTGHMTVWLNIPGPKVYDWEAVTGRPFADVSESELPEILS